MNDPVPFEFNQPTVVALLYLASVVTGLPMLIGVVLAYVWKGKPAADWENSHYRFHIRSFWIGIALGILAAVPTVLTLGIAGFVLYPMLVLWFALRTVKALLAAQQHEPIAAVETWVW